MNVEDLYRILRTSHVQAQGVVDTIDEPLVVLDERGVVIDANRAFFGTFLVERDDTIGVPLRDLGNKQWNIPELNRLVSDIVPKSTAIIDYEVTHEFPKIGRRTFLLTARRMWKPDDNSTQVLLAFEDVTNARARERENSLLLSELRHRMTNLLGVVRALANQTDTEGKTAEEYKSAFLGRFEALMRAQSLMVEGRPAIALADLVTELVGGLGGKRVRITAGPEVFIAGKQVVPLTMILHELGTNALKYGALSAAGDGSIQIDWETANQNEPRCLRLHWREHCETPPKPPTRAGVGTEMIKTGALLGLGGAVELNFGPTGLQADLVMPLVDDHGRSR